MNISVSPDIIRQFLFPDREIATSDPQSEHDISALDQSIQLSEQYPYIAQHIRRTGYIQLPSPVIHPWFTDTIVKILDRPHLTARVISQISDGTYHLVIKPGILEKQQIAFLDIIDLLDPEQSPSYSPTQEEANALLPDNHPDKWIVETGAHAIEMALKTLFPFAQQKHQGEFTRDISSHFDDILTKAKKETEHHPLLVRVQIKVNSLSES